MPDYQLIMTFTAADDRQAHRLGMACANTCAVHYGTRAPFVIGGGEEEMAPEEAEDDIDQLYAVLDELFRLRVVVSAELAQIRQELAASRHQLDRVRALLERVPGGSVYTVPHGDCGSQEVLPAADLRVALRPVDPDRPDALQAAIESLLLNRRNELLADHAEPDLAELAEVYAQRTGWTVDDDPEEPGLPAG